MTRTLTCSFFALALTLTGCPAEMVNPDSGSPMTDSGAPSDGGPPMSSGTCASVGAQIMDACDTDQSERRCLWGGLADVCTGEDTSAFVVAMECIRDASADGCRTFSDPSSADSCLRTRLAPFADDAERALADDIVALCAGDRDQWLYTSVLPLAPLAAATTARMQACVDAASGCDAVNDCFEAELSEVADCFGGGGGECAARASEVAAACAGQADRTCEWVAIGGLCDQTDETAMELAMQCILDASSGSCRTFSDPSGAADCIETALEPYVTEDAEAVADQLDALCGTTFGDRLYVSTPPLAALDGSTLLGIRACTDAAGDCATAEACFETLQETIVACYE